MTELLTGLGFDLSTHLGIFYLASAWTFFVVTVIWVIGNFQGNHSMMDGYYGFGYASQAWIAYYFSGTMSATATVILVITSLHGCRLGFYLSKRWLGYRKSGGGDQRYLGFVTKLAPGYWWKSFFMVMQPQTVVIILIGLPSTMGLMAAMDNNVPINLLTIIGVVVFGIGYYFEVVADGQLQAFKADKPHNAGRYLQTGVWTYSRHPNYFGNTTVWWGIWIVAVSTNFSIWWTIAGPIMNTIMLTGILGRAFQDKFMGSRPEYQKLMARTSSFLPIPPKK